MIVTETFTDNLLACFDWPKFLMRCNQYGELEPTIEILQHDPERTQSLVNTLPSVLCMIVAGYAVEIHAIPCNFRLYRECFFVRIHVTPSCGFRFRIECISGVITCSYFDDLSEAESSPFQLARKTVCRHDYSCNHLEIFRYYLHHKHQLDLFASNQDQRCVRRTAKSRCYLYWSSDEGDLNRCATQLKFNDHALAKHYLLLVDCVYKELVKQKDFFFHSVRKLCDSFLVQTHGKNISAINDIVAQMS